MSAAMACSDFLQTSGKCPASLTMPPACPPMPSAQVLQAFFERMAFHSLTNAAHFARLAQRIPDRRPAAATLDLSHVHDARVETLLAWNLIR